MDIHSQLLFVIVRFFFTMKKNFFFFFYPHLCMPIVHIRTNQTVLYWTKVPPPPPKKMCKGIESYVEIWYRSHCLYAKFWDKISINI